MGVSDLIFSFWLTAFMSLAYEYIEKFEFVPTLSSLIVIVFQGSLVYDADVQDFCIFVNEVVDIQHSNVTRS